MLFEADTYGYRLVMPMYAPILAVASQAPLALIRAAFRLRSKVRVGRSDAFATAGWSIVALVALVWQAKALADVLPRREAVLHGLGGAAAQAAATVDRVGADAVYVASMDGTPRRFGAGMLTGLRYPWFKWYDPARSLPLPPDGSTAVYVLSELSGQTLEGDLSACLGQADANQERIVTASEARQLCVGDWPASSALRVEFEGVARIDALRVPERGEAGQAIDARLLWEPLVARPAPQQMFSLQLDDPPSGEATQWGNGTLELYPSNQWQPGDVLLSRLPIVTDATAIPQPYRLTIGLGAARANVPAARAVVAGARVRFC
jgi:hypothetical protein